MQLKVRNSTTRIWPLAVLLGTGIDTTADHTNPGTRNAAVTKTASKLPNVMGWYYCAKNVESGRVAPCENGQSGEQSDNRAP